MKQYTIHLRADHIKTIQHVLNAAVNTDETLSARAALDSEVQRADFYMNRLCVCGAKSWEHGAAGEDCRAAGCRQFIPFENNRGDK